MRKWNLSSSRFGFKVHTYEVPRHAVVLASLFDNVCWATRGWLGGHGLPEKFFEIPVGKPRYDADGDLENSIGLTLYNLETAVHQYAFHRETNRVEIDITAEQARAIDPEFVKNMEAINFLPDDYEAESSDNVLPFKKP